MTKVTRYTPSLLALVLLLFAARGVGAAERLCDTSFEDCRAPLLELIENEKVSGGIDVAFHFMTDTMLSDALISKHQAGVPVRVLFDSRADDESHEGSEVTVNALAAAGVPMRTKVGYGILHWKMMLFAGQGVVVFSAANFSANAYVPQEPFLNYVDEVVYFCDDPAVVNSFKTKYDNSWVSTTLFASHANVTTLARRYPIYPKDSALNFPASEPYYNRAVTLFNKETQKIDVAMYRISEDRYADAVIAALKRGVAVRILGEPNEYRRLDRIKTPYNIDRMYAAGAQVRFRKHQGLAHQKTVLLHGQATTIHGSSNWGDSSSEEHNYFTTKPWFFQYFTTQFERKWGSATEYQPFVPLPPDLPVNKSPAKGALKQPTTQTLKWDGGPWAHKFDVLIGTEPSNLRPIVQNARYPAANDPLSPVLLSGSNGGTTQEAYAVSNLAPSTTYYWQVVGKTMAGKAASGPVWSFTTAPPISLTLTPATISGPCQSSSGKVTLSGPAPTGGAVVTLTNGNRGATMPASVTIPAGATSSAFTISSLSVSSKAAGNVTASYNGSSSSSTLAVLPLTVKTLTLTPSTVAGGATVSGSVTLTCPSPASGVVVTLTSSAPSIAAVPSSVTLPAGTTTGTFTVRTSDVSVLSYATITATVNGISKSAKLTLNP